MTADTQDAERLRAIRSKSYAWIGAPQRELFGVADVRFLLRLLDARNARIAALEEECKAAKGLMRLSDEMHRSAEEKLREVRALAAEAQRGNAATIGELRDKLAQAWDHLQSVHVSDTCGCSFCSGARGAIAALRPAAAAERERTT